jgi:hypothetical protein
MAMIRRSALPILVRNIGAERHVRGPLAYAEAVDGREDVVLRAVAGEVHERGFGADACALRDALGDGPEGAAVRVV